MNAEAVQTATQSGGLNPLEHSEPAGYAGYAGYSGSENLTKAQQDEFAELLDAVRNWYRRFIYVVNERDYNTLTLWTVHTWLVEQSRTTPRLLIDSPVPESGKTTLLEHLEKLTANPVRLANAGTPASLTRLLQSRVYTLLLDEADRTLNPKKEDIGDLYATLNTGYKFGGYRLVSVKRPGGDWEAEQLPTYAPVAMAGNNPQLPDDTRSRCITIRLLKDTQGRVQESDWEFIEPDANDLRERIKQQVEVVQDLARTIRPNLPPECRNRNKERWQPLKQVAALAGERWEQLADEAITSDLEQLEAERAEQATNVKPSVQVQLDLKDIFEHDTREFIPTSELVEMLRANNPELWLRAEKPLSAQGLGQMLSKSVGVNSTRRNQIRGYSIGQFTKQWEALSTHPLGNRPNRPNRQEPLEHAEVAVPVLLTEPPQMPVTCAVCGGELHAIHYADGTHPTCERGESV